MHAGFAESVSGARSQYSGINCFSRSLASVPACHRWNSGAQVCLARQEFRVRPALLDCSPARSRWPRRRVDSALRAHPPGVEYRYWCRDARDTRTRAEKVRLRGALARHLSQRRDVVENPERTPVSSDDQVVFVDPQIAHGCMRQIQLQRLPMIAVVKRNPHRVFGSGKKRPLRTGSSRTVLTAALWAVLRDLLPGFSAIMSAVDVGTKIVNPKTAHRNVGRLIIKVRRTDLRDLAPGGERRRGNIFPILAASRVSQTRPSSVPAQMVFALLK